MLFNLMFLIKKVLDNYRINGLHYDLYIIKFLQFKYFELQNLLSRLETYSNLRSKYFN